MHRLIAAARELLWRIHARARRADLARELDEEMRFHRDLLARDLRAAGLSADDAAAAARRKFGSTLRLRERSADLWGFPRLEETLQDVRYGLRVLRRSPGFAAVAICATAVAIGINAGFFTLVDSLVWRPIPVADASSLVRLETVLADRATSSRFSHPEYEVIARRSRSLRDVTAFAPGQVALADPIGGRRALAVGAGFVSGNYFTVLGGGAQRGRPLVDSDDRAGAPPAAVISDHLWRTAFAAEPNVVGRDVRIDGVSVTIVGVAETAFIGVTPVVPDVWLPIALAVRLGAIGGSLGERANRFLFLHGHLEAATSRERAASEITALIAEPAPPAGSVGRALWVSGARVVPQSSLVPLDAQTAKIALPGFVAVGLVLVIACANLGVLLLARALARQREVSVRMALGASRARLLRQLVSESLLIAALGAAVGLVLADWTITAAAKALIHTLPVSIGTVVLDLRPSIRVYLYAAALATMSAVVFGLVPALHGTAIDLNAALKGEDRVFGARLRRSRFRDALVGAQVAACVVLAVAAAILVRSLRDSLRADTTLDVTNVRVATLGLDRPRSAAGVSAARAELAHRVRALPGVARSARAGTVPFSGAWDRLHVAVSERAAVRALPYNIVTPGYFDVVGQRIVRGRDFAAGDSSAATRAAIVTEAAARTLWPRQDPIGQTLYAVRPRRSEPDSVTAYEVVGVAADARSGSLWGDDSGGYVFLLASPTQMAAAGMPILIREDASARGLEAALGELAVEIDPSAPFETMRLTRLLDAQVTPFRYGARIATAIGALGLAFAAVGLYAVVAFAVSQRRREIAVRVAIGATPRDVLTAVVEREVRVIAVGLAVGTVMAIGEAGLLGATGIPFSSLGLPVFVAVPVALFAVAFLATIVPARLALRVDPMQALRQD